MNNPIVSVVNALLSVNRLGRGNAALFLLLSFGAIGTEISLLTHLVLAHTAALWYNGLNDLLDLEIDRAAYTKSPYRKALLNGAMTARGLWWWLALLLLASAVLLVVDVRANFWGLGLFAAGILCSVVYDKYSKYLARPSVASFILLDAVVGGPFYFYYLSLAVAAAARPDMAVVVGAVASLFLCGLFGNFIFAAKDLSTDAKRTTTLPMLFGSTLDASGVVRHSPMSQAYLILLFGLLAVLAGYLALHGHWFALVFAARFLVATVQICSGKITERGHKKLFIRLSNWEMALLLSLFVWRIGPFALAQLILLGLLTILANVAYYYDDRANRVLMLRFARRAQA
jgi:hypothetical protein